MKNGSKGLALKMNFFFLCTREKDKKKKKTGEEASWENSHLMVSIYEGVEILCVHVRVCALMCICMSSWEDKRDIPSGKIS